MAQAVATKIVLSYSMSLADMLTACKHIGKVDPFTVDTVTEDNFPISGEGEVLMPFLERLRAGTDTIGTNRARTLLNEKKLRPATLPELLMFMGSNPEEATKHPIVALSPVTITPTGDFKVWHGECQQSFVPTIINRTRFHDGSQLVRAGEPEIFLVPEFGTSFGHRSSMDWYFAVLPA